MPHLIQLNPDGTLAWQWQLGGDPIVFGRGEAADVQIEDQEMSKRHFQIERQGDSYIVRDLQSSNGTWIDKKKVVEAELKAGEEFRAGKTVFVFEKTRSTIIGDLAQEKQGYKIGVKDDTKKIDPKEKRP